MNINELNIILLSDKPSDILKNKEKELFSLIPELEKCKGFDQNNDWHIYDVYEHIMHVIDGTPKDISIRYAALFHDIGKPYSYKEDENGIGHFYGHWEISKKIFDSFISKYNINCNTNLISNLIWYHDKSILKEDKDELINIFGIDGLKLLFDLKKADHLAQNPIYYYYLDKIEEERNMILNGKGCNI